ncbi:hypothetical protein [Geodermatophilus normandii]|uniref:Uncharacterized protein n=1 Tax=Geodermatophilus normandii TaxID=1137989 RepID=A0A6P0GIU4_9ACTN|nr:hypothetical protein [Geodermatophilus normandii]NEM07189.1 hypothetical protein [Geodermatophilus normandii]
MTTATRPPAAVWAATHRTLLAIVAVTVALAVAAAVTLTVLLGDSGTTSPTTGSDWDRSGCGGVMTVTFLRPTC